MKLGIIADIHGNDVALLLEDRGDDLVATHRDVSYDAQAVVCDLRRRRHPNAEFVASVLTGQRQM